MRSAVFRAMLLGLLRDRGALAMSFLLPGLLFLVLALIFAEATGAELRLTLAVADEVRSENSRRLVAALGRDPSLELVRPEASDGDAVRRLVRRGTADVGLIVRAGGRELDDLGGFGAAPLVIVSDPVRGVAAPMLAGQLQRVYFEALPDVALAGVVNVLEDQFIELDELQREELDDGLAELREETAGGATGWSLKELSEVEAVAGVSGRLNHVAYYAGAIAVLFVLFSAVNGAISLLEERERGLADRVLAGPASTAVLLDGKFLFLTLQGFVQIGVIFLIAWSVYGVDLPRHVAPWALITLATAAAAAGAGLFVAAACRTPRQAHTVASVAILLASALGGSMVPRFLMPPLLQDLGWITPNTWAIEAYASVFWRGQGWSQLALPVGILFVMAALGSVAARLLPENR